MREDTGYWFMTCHYCGSEMPEQEYRKFVCPLCGHEHDHDAYLRKWKIRESVGVGHKDFVLHPDLVGWPRFLLCGMRMRQQPDGLSAFAKNFSKGILQRQAMTQGDEADD